MQMLGSFYFNIPFASEFGLFKLQTKHVMPQHGIPLPDIHHPLLGEMGHLTPPPLPLAGFDASDDMKI